MAHVSTFDPFHNRLCRDIRNDLSIHLMDSIKTGDISPVVDVVEKYKSQDVESFMNDYMGNRLRLYQRVLSEISSQNIPLEDTYRIACCIWNQALFFEFHEWLEHQWHVTYGPEKELIQALIRSAGVYLLLESGRKKGAQKMAVKAVAGLRKTRAYAPGFFDITRLIDSISEFDPLPPKFRCG